MTFIVGLRRLRGPRTARSGNRLAALGMLAVVVLTLVSQDIVNWRIVAAGLATGAVVGVWAAIRVRMTAMPQMVAVFNGSGGIASALVAATAVADAGLGDLPMETMVSILVSTVIGTVTFTGSLVAFGDWGWALQDGQEVVITAQGAVRRVDGRLLDSRQADVLVLSRGSVVLVAGSSVQVVTERTPAVIDGAISPDGRRVAVLDNTGVTVVNLEGAVPPVRHDLPVSLSQVAWSSDSRFLIVPASSRGVRVIDTQTGDSSVHLVDVTVTWVGVIPLSGA